MKAKDESVRELLKLLKKNPDLISALVLDPEQVQRLLKSKAARRLANGVNVENFLRKLSDDPDGGPIALCIERTRYFCGGGTRFRSCGGGTKPHVPTPPK